MQWKEGMFDDIRMFLLASFSYFGVAHGRIGCWYSLTVCQREQPAFLPPPKMRFGYAMERFIDCCSLHSNKFIDVLSIKIAFRPQL
jgi:hypothetical protein